MRASAADWLRDGFGEGAGFTAFVAEDGDSVIGMATCSRRTITGWSGPVIFLQDLFVEPAYRQHGIASALIARVAAFAEKLGSPIVELTVRADNPAQIFYQRSGFQPLPHCLTYVLAGPALAALAERDKQKKESKEALAARRLSVARPLRAVMRRAHACWRSTASASLRTIAAARSSAPSRR